MELKAKKGFSWAHDGVRVEEFTKGQIITTKDPDLIKVSLEEGWTEKTKQPAKGKKDSQAGSDVDPQDDPVADDESSDADPAAPDADPAAAPDPADPARAE